MAFQSSVQFIDTALFCTTSFRLTYSDPDQKWLIRKHLLSLLQEFPSLKPSMDTFTHNDGSVVRLLNASGDLRISASAPNPVPLTIWLHENYPHAAPIVFFSSSPNSSHLVQYHDHPFIDSSSGSITSSYLLNWVYPKCNLSDLVRSLVKLFFAAPLVHPSLATKMDAMDRVARCLHGDMAALTAQTEEEIEGLSALQAEMVQRVDIAASLIIGLEHEKTNLKRRVMELSEEADVLMNWLRVHDKKYNANIAGLGDHGEDCAFEGSDEECEIVLDRLAQDSALEDLIYALDKAVEEGVVSLDMYIRQVRALGREQFFHRAVVVKLRGPEMLTWPDSSQHGYNGSHHQQSDVQS